MRFQFPLPMLLAVNLSSLVVIFPVQVSAASLASVESKRKTDYLPKEEKVESKGSHLPETKNSDKTIPKDSLSGSETSSSASSSAPSIDIDVDGESGEDEGDFITGDDGQFTSSSSAIGDNFMLTSAHSDDYHEPTLPFDSVNLDHLLYPVQTMYGGSGSGFGNIGGGESHYSDHYSGSYDYKDSDHYDHKYDQHQKKQPDYKSDHHHHNSHHDQKYDKHKKDHHDSYKGGDGGHHKKEYHSEHHKKADDDDQLANATRTILRQRTRSLDGSVRCRVFGRLRERPSSLLYNRLTGRIRNQCRLRGVHVRSKFGRKKRRKHYYHHPHHHYDDYHHYQHHHNDYDHDDYYRR